MDTYKIDLIDKRAWLPVIIKNPHTEKTIKVYGLVDTGADECAFPAGFANKLGHKLDTVRPRQINTGNGITNAYPHTVCIKFNDFEINNVLIDFMPNLSVPLLGIKSFLSNFIITINYPDNIFSLQNIMM